MGAKFLNPDGMSKPTGYTHVVEVSGTGRTIYIAGQLGLRADGSLGEDFRTQAEQAFKNLETAMAAVGGGLEHIVKVTYFLVDIGYLPVMREIRNHHFTKGPLPASTAVAITALALPSAVFEVEAIAFIPS
ncbi:RutC family protein YjgH [Variibacter gotjawalensis]|uniref:RutC family protein YjgH n=1 Tax=Variibacter gotjawalensis TaxID=1333996 RepID=A0A0S3PV78_9BRAD|nr:RidA family protein [Variibacter gotjawalensis]NIK45687.1 enamine deaminase RidA (YjgF/YER057c/UK114 family) [Variibacter gotjawalensis]RZS47614.1 enamine deaminase RidA (YjgF/YER057c/UK114 family) [Variibacter gotjawalensis]BAT59866.1 RutC family protein YjgH [Variibacter gotjawalensis]